MSNFLCPTFSRTTPPPNIRIINGYVTVEPPLTHQEQHRRMETYATEHHPSAPSSTLPNPSSAQPALVHSTLTLSCLLTWLLSHILFTCWPQDNRYLTNTQTLLRPYQSSGMYLISKDWTSTRAEKRWRNVYVWTWRPEAGQSCCRPWPHGWLSTGLPKAKENFKMGVKSENVWNKLSAMTQTLTGLSWTVNSQVFKPHESITIE